MRNGKEKTERNQGLVKDVLTNVLRARVQRILKEALDIKI